MYSTTDLTRAVVIVVPFIVWVLGKGSIMTTSENTGMTLKGGTSAK